LWTTYVKNLLCDSNSWNLLPFLWQSYSKTNGWHKSSESGVVVKSCKFLQHFSINFFCIPATLQHKLLISTTMAIVHWLEHMRSLFNYAYVSQVFSLNKVSMLNLRPLKNWYLKLHWGITLRQILQWFSILIESGP
jgi:hypothetical protein